MALDTQGGAVMTARKWLQSAYDPAAGGLLVVHGEEAYWARAVTAKLRREVVAPEAEMDTEIIDGPAATPADCVLAAQGMAWMSPQRLVLVRDPAFAQGKKAFDWKPLIEYAGSPNPGSLLAFVFAVALPAKHPLLDLPNTVVLEGKKANDDTARDLAREWAKQQGVAMSQEAAFALIEQAGVDLCLLENEMKKLCDGSGGTITPELVRELAVSTTDYRVWQIVEAACLGQAQKSMELLAVAFGAGEAAPAVMAAFARQLHAMLCCKQLQSQKQPLGQLQSLLGMPGFAVEKAGKQAKRYSVAQLRKGLEGLATAEVEYKRGEKKDAELAVYGWLAAWLEA